MNRIYRTPGRGAQLAHGLGMPWNVAAADFSSNATTKKLRPGSREVS
jgi:hypothetical protein